MLVRLNQVVFALFWHDAPQIEDVVVLFQPVLANQLRCARLVARHAVGNQQRLAPIGVRKILLHAVAQHNQLIRVAHRHLLAQLDALGRNAVLPFRARPVQPVYRYDNALAHQLRQPAEQRRPFRVHMQHVIIAHRRAKAAEETCGNRRQPLLLDGRYILQADAVEIFGLRLLFVGSVIARHGMPLRHHALGQFAHHNLDAAIMGRYALLSDHGNFHILPSHPLQPPLLHEISHYEGEGNPISSPDALRCTFRCHLMH